MRPLELTAKAQENKPKAERKGLSSNYPFFRACVSLGHYKRNPKNKDQRKNACFFPAIGQEKMQYHFQFFDTAVVLFFLKQPWNDF